MLMTRRLLLFTAIALAMLAAIRPAHAHGTLVDGRMYQVRVAGPSGHTPALWNESYYTWNQNSHNFPDYAASGFSYATTVPDGTIGYAGINDGVQSGLDFRGLETPSVNWLATAATAGQSLALHWVATAPHDPSYFEVYLTKQGFDVATQHLQWGMLERLGRWSPNDPAHPVTNATAPSPSGGTSLSYDWNIPIPADRTGRHVVIVIWQRQDPAGEAFFAVQDLTISAASNSATPTALDIARRTDGAFLLHLQGAPNETWQIEKNDGLAAGGWTPLVTATADNSGALDVADDQAGAARFYRAVPTS